MSKLIGFTFLIIIFAIPIVLLLFAVWDINTDNCEECERISFKTQIITKKNSIFSYNVCKKCYKKIELDNKIYEQKKKEYDREDELIDRELYSEAESMTRKLFRSLDKIK